MNFGIGPLRTGVLNIADLSVVVGIILLFIITMQEEKGKKSSNPAPKAAEDK
jgi:lipoprotein signal peptidase